MAISLQKGGNVNLSKEAPGLTKLLVGLGWDARSTDGAAFDLDGAVVHSGDNTTGAGEGDDETLNIDLSKVAADVDKIAVCVTIHEAEARRQNFGMVSKAYVRCVNAGDNKEIARYDLSEDGSTESAMIFGEVYRAGTDWKFRAIGQGFKGGLGPLAKNYGVNV
jgi:tellurium resistance protein TerD